MAISRTYRYTDSRLLELAKVIQTHLIAHETVLRQHDPQISSQWFERILQDAEAHGLDDFERGKVATRTRQYNAASKYLRKQLGHLRFYMNEAIEEDAVAVAASFLSSYREKRNRKAAFMLWMHSFGQQLSACRAALEQVGAPAVLLDGFLARIDLLLTAGGEQAQMKQMRSRSAGDRVAAANRLYAALRRVERLASIIFTTDEEGEEDTRLYLFKLPSSRKVRKRIADPGVSQKQPEPALVSSEQVRIAPLVLLESETDSPQAVCYSKPGAVIRRWQHGAAGSGSLIPPPVTA